MGNIGQPIEAQINGAVDQMEKAVDCMVACLNGERKIDNYREKSRDWNLFTKLMLSTWIKMIVQQK